MLALPSLPADGKDAFRLSYVAGDIVYAAARSPQGAEVSMLAIGAEKGELRWQLALGAAQAGQTYCGEPDLPAPTLLPRGGGHVYVLTNNGALLAVDTGARCLEWAYTYAPPPTVNRQMFWNGNASAARPKREAAVFVQGSTLYLKEQDGDAVHAVDLAGPSLRWRRAIDPENTVARLPGGRRLPGGQDLAAIDAETRAMAWSASLPSLVTRMTPLLGEGRLLAFTPRGIHGIDLANGDTVRIRRGADRDSMGGTLCRAPGRLISASNLAITAYPTGDATPQVPGR